MPPLRLLNFVVFCLTVAGSLALEVAWNKEVIGYDRRNTLQYVALGLVVACIAVEAVFEYAGSRTGTKPTQRGFPLDKDRP